MAAKTRIGVLALQGDFEAHERALERAGAEAIEIRAAQDLDRVDGLIIPGGESTTMLKLIDQENLFEPLRRFGERKPIFGTCAGAILLARGVSNPVQRSLGLMDIDVQRNGYGRQLDSSIASLQPDAASGLGADEVEAVFIRAPVITRVGGDARVLASYRNAPVLVEQGRFLASTFHPELTADGRIHRHFVSKVAAEAPVG
jgi:5'-phosphate synthase pdxT subunit